MTKGYQINRKEMEHVGNFGVELELINVDIAMLINALRLKGIECIDEGYTHRTTSHWKLVGDSSIRCPNNRGYELVSPILTGTTGMMQLREVCKALAFVDTDVNFSCGLHIHHQAPYNLTEQQKTNLMKFYARLERTIDAFMPKSRKRNTSPFCRSMVQAYTSCAGYSNMAGLGRYYKLNFAALSRQNTLEFRQHAGSIDFEKIYHWICFTASFIATCKDKTSTNAMNYIERAWTPKHLKLQKRTWSYFKGRMKKLDDLDRSLQNVRADMGSLEHTMSAGDVRSLRIA